MLLLRNTRPLLLAFGIAIACLISLSIFGSHAHEGTKRVVMGVVGKVKDQGAKIGLGSSVASHALEEEEDSMREWEYRRALMYEGSGARIHAFLEKAQSGRPFTVSVIGGSVSKGRGLVPPPGSPADRRREEDPPEPLSGDTQDAVSHLGASTLYSSENLHVMVFDWLNASFPHPGNRLVNGAQGGVGAGYFGWCFKEHIAEESDLVLVELGINDLVEMEVVDAYEHLIRGLLELPSKPAVINIETFSTLFPTLLSSSALHQDVAAFYDVPSISLRDVIIPRILADPDIQLPKWFRTGGDVVLGDSKVREWGGIPVDLMQISALGHALAAGLVIRYFSEQLGRTKSAAGLGAWGPFAPSNSPSSSVRVIDVPRTSLTSPFDPRASIARFNPYCISMNSAHLSLNSKGKSIQGLSLSEGSSGWTAWSWKEKNYLVAKEPGSLAVFAFSVSPMVTLIPNEDVTTEQIDMISPTAETVREYEPVPIALRPGGPYNLHQIGVPVDSSSSSQPRPRLRSVIRRQHEEEESWDEGGRVLVGYQRSATYGLGSVWCWVDEDRGEGTMIDGWWDIAERNMGMVTEVASGLSAGPHTLSCELLDHTLDPRGRTEFRIFAIMHD